MPLSEETKTPVSGNYVIEDGSATPVFRLNPAEVPSTTVDMIAAFNWKHGEKLYGSHAKENEALKRYRTDINNAYGRERDYDDNMIFVDTLNKKTLVSEQLNKLKK